MKAGRLLLLRWYCLPTKPNQPHLSRLWRLHHEEAQELPPEGDAVTLTVPPLAACALVLG